MRAAFVAVGAELLGTDRLDTNSLRVTRLLRRHGVALGRKSVVGDDSEELGREIGALAGRYDLVVTSGGLGPTSDDLTREAVAEVLGRSLEENPEIVADIESKFRSFGRRMPEVNRRQALVPSGATVLANRRGTAPGLHLESGGTAFFLFPGVPNELAGMLEGHLEPWLESRASGEGLETAMVKIACLPESEVEERIAPAYEELGRENLALLASPGEIRVELHATGPDESRRETLAGMRARIRELVGTPVFTEDPDETLEAVVVRALAEAGETVATGESCTGGQVAERITSVPGSSEVFLGGVVAYSNRAKSELLGVPASEIEEHGAVSEPVARSLAAGARRALGSDWGIGITGIAGPGGGTEDKLVGTVHVAVDGRDTVDHREVRFPGDRERVRRFTSQLALEILRRRVLGLPTGRERGE